MARIKIARGSKANLPADLMYGELYWEKEQAGTSDGVLVMGHPDGAAKDPMPIAGARAMKSLYFEGLWDASTGAYPTGAQVGSFYVASADGTGSAATFKYGDWAICIAVNQDGSTQWIKAINQAITTEDPLNLNRNPLDLTDGVIRLKYASDTLEIDSNGKLALKTYELFTAATGVTIADYSVVAINASGNAIVADFTAETTATVAGIAISTETGVVKVQKFGRITNPAWVFADVGGPVWLGATGALLQGTENITSGHIAVQIGIAVSTTTLELNIGTPFLFNLPSDINYIPLTNKVTAGDVAHAPTADAVYQAISNTGSLYATAAQGILATNALPASSYTAADVLAKMNSANPASQGRYVICGSGTTFPGTPGFADEFYRTDLGEWYKFNGTAWMQISTSDALALVNAING